MTKNKEFNFERAFGFLVRTIVVLVVLLIMAVIILVGTCKNNETDGVNETTVSESGTDHNAVIPPANVLQGSGKYRITYSQDWSEEDRYLLAKIAMAEAEGESLETKVLVILTILNRVHSSEPYFPDTIREVIFQSRSGVYQFTPIANGRWDRVEPNDECWKAVDIASQLDYDKSCGALYFEACTGESWHSRNLEFILKSDNTRFYK